MPGNNPIETLFMSFCKQLLGVQKQTTNAGVLLELGQLPLLIRAREKAIKNWVRMTTGTNCPDIVLDSLYNAKQENLPWMSSTENILSEIGLRQSFLDNDIDLHLQAFQRLQDIHYQNIFRALININVCPFRR